MRRIAFTIFCLCVGCGDDRVYLGDDKLYQVALTASTAPVIAGDEGSLFIMETRAEANIARPRQADVEDLYSGASAYPDLPFPRLPWVERGDLELTVDFTLSNLDDQAHDIAVIINGANEFDEYFPPVLVIDDVPVPLYSQWERTYTVEPKSRLSRTVREEELDEAAVDLATVVNGAPNADQVVYFENKSESDERSGRYIPDVIPGLIALRIGLRTGVAAPILLEATVRARDVGEKLADDGDPTFYLQPEPFRPEPIEP